MTLASPAGDPASTASNAVNPAVLQAVAAADRVEVKRTIADASLGDVMAAASGDLRDAEVRRVYYFDTPELSLHRAGVILRARDLGRGRGDADAKLRPAALDHVPRSWAHTPEATLEADVDAGICAYTIAYKRRCDSAELQAVLRGDRPPVKLFAKRQRLMLAQCADVEVPWPTLRTFGPATVLRLEAAGSDIPLVIERWQFSDHPTLTELSVKTEPARCHELSARLDTLAERFARPGLTAPTSKAARTLAAGQTGHHPADDTLSERDTG